MTESTAPEPLRINAYYFSFEPTGIVEIDRILSAVACAGKAFHNTEWWDDEPALGDPDGRTYVGLIQQAANEAAAAIKEAKGE